MYRAKVFYSRGWGLEVGTIKADSFAVMTEKVNTVLASNFKVEKIEYSYPSGKSYTKIF